VTFIDASADDVARVEAALGRPVAGRFAVVVRRVSGEVIVIENEPHMKDGTPMPTLLWLVDPELHEAVSRIEGAGGVHRFEETINADELAETHRDYAQRREAATLRHEGPQPSGGVGGTRVGIKCLHAHLANHLAGFNDPVGREVASLIDIPPYVIESVRP
jgi:hypothetical protein